MAHSEGTPLLRHAGGGSGGATASSAGYEEDATPRSQRIFNDNKHDLALPTRSKRRRWGGAALAGAFMFGIAGAGLVAIFNAIQGAIDSDTGASSKTSLEQMLETRGRQSGVDGRGGQDSLVRNVEQRSAETAKRETGSSAPRRPVEEWRAGNVDVEDVRPRDPTADERPGEQQHKTAATKKGAGYGEPGVRGRLGENEPASFATKPNVFFIMIDDMGWNDIGYQSTDLSAVTPVMDRLAAGGIKMTNYYTMSICTPSRASLMTGRYPVRYGLQYNVIQPGAPWALPTSEKIFPQYMNDLGYDSHMIGKWHLGSYNHEYTPHRRGFNTYLGYLNDEERYWTHQSWTASLNGNLFFDFGFGNKSGYFDIINRETPTITASSSSNSSSGESWSSTTTSNSSSDSSSTTSSSSSSSSSSTSSCTTCAYAGKYSTTIFTERAMELLHDKTPYDEEPLFLYLAHQAVHDPLGLPSTDSFNEAEWALLDSIRPTEPVRKKFAKVLMYLDKSIGAFVTALEDGGWLENSIIVVASDNGGCPVNGGNNYPLRGLKHSYWEGGNKVPSFVYSKSHIPEELRGTSYDGLMHVTDWLPTILGAVGGEAVGSFGPLDGMNHWDYIMGNAGDEEHVSPRTEFLYNFDPYILWADGDDIESADYPLAQGAYRSGKWKLMMNVWCSGYYTFDAAVALEDPLTNPSNVCFGEGECSTCGQSCTSGYNHSDWLVDLEADPREEVNLIMDYPEIAHELRERAKEVAFKEWMDSSYEEINKSSYYVWAKHGWWMLPWYDEKITNSSR